MKRIAQGVVWALLLGLVAGLASAALAGTGAPRLLAPIRKYDGCHARDHGVSPDRACTPGAVFSGVGRAQLCRRGYSRTVRNVPESVKRKVYAAYGIRHHTRGQYEVDHVVALEDGGANVGPHGEATANLFPQPYHGTNNARVKDRLENRFRVLICSGRLTMASAQHQLASNWVRAYHREFG